MRDVVVLHTEITCLIISFSRTRYYLAPRTVDGENVRVARTGDIHDGLADYRWHPFIELNYANPPVLSILLPKNYIMHPSTHLSDCNIFFHIDQKASENYNDFVQIVDSVYTVETKPLAFTIEL